jgi:ferredoxin
MIDVDPESIPWQIRRGTANRKLGPGAWVVTIGRDSCPASCPFKNAGCYAESGPLAMAWRRVSSGAAKGDGVSRWTGVGASSLAATLDTLPIPRGSMIRLGDAGDISFGAPYGVPDTLDRAVRRLIHRGVDVIAYSHSQSPALPYWVNRSREGMDVHDAYYAYHASVSTYATPEDIPDTSSIVRCPAEYRDDVTCDSCRLCAKTSRSSVVAFTVHGSSSARAREAIRLG